MFTLEKHRGFVRELQVQREATDALTRAAMVRTAEREKARVLREQTARSGIAPHYRQIVDGEVGAPLTKVKASGIIVFVWSYFLEVVSEAVAALAAAVPVLTGNLLNHIHVYIDGERAELGEPGEVSADLFSAATKRVVIVVDVVYARRLEVGYKNDGSPMVWSVKQHFVEHTAIVLQSRFRDQARISFEYSDLTGSPLSNFGSATRSRSRRKQPIRYPSIIIEPRMA